MSTDNQIMNAQAFDGGKKIRKIEARVSDDLKDDLRLKWSADGFESESECIELLAAVYTYGTEHVRMMQERKFRRVCVVSDALPTVGAA